MKNQTVRLITLIIVLGLATMACGGVNISIPRSVKGNGVVTEEIRDVDGFDRIEINGLGDVRVELGERESLTVEAEENLLPYLETYVRGSTLVLEVEDGRNILPTESVRFFLTVVSLDAVDVSGLGNVKLPEIEADRFNVNISGAGNIDFDALYADSLNVVMSGLGDLTVDEGEVYSQGITISGSGKYSAEDLESEEANITISGLGSATLRVSDYLKVIISGGGDVEYYGNPEVDSEISGVGDLDRLGD